MVYGLVWFITKQGLVYTSSSESAQKRSDKGLPLHVILVSGLMAVECLLMPRLLLEFVYATTPSRRASGAGLSKHEQGDT